MEQGLRENPHYAGSMADGQQDTAASQGYGADQSYGRGAGDSEPGFIPFGGQPEQPFGSQMEGNSQPGQPFGGQMEGNSQPGQPFGGQMEGGGQFGQPWNGQAEGNGQPFGNRTDDRNSRFYQNPQAGNGQPFPGPADRRVKKQKAPKVKKQRGFGMTMTKCAALALVFGLVSGTVFYGTGKAFEYTMGGFSSEQASTGNNQPSSVTTKSGDLSATSVSTATTVTDVSDIVENVMPSIVSITNMGQQELGQDFFGRRYVQDTESAGSGIIIAQTEKEIYIATNNHVVAGSTQLTVNFIDDQTVSAEIKGTDPSTDLAVLSIQSKDIPSETMEKIKVATLGDSDNLKVGQGTVAIGNALGYGQSVTTGVISAIGREVTVQDENTGASITNDLIQTSAAINPGNSGGALLNMNGEVIGINSVKYTDTQVEGMGFSIPISEAEPIINDLITREVVDESKSAFLGVQGQDVDEEFSVSFGIPEGLYITLVQENTAAAQAGIKKGDVLTEFDGRKIRSMESLSEVIQYYAAGTEVELTLQVNENGEWQEKKVMVTLGKKNGQ